MIKFNCTLNVTCDGNHGYEVSATFTGDSYAQCRKAMRLAKWRTIVKSRINKHGRRIITSRKHACPECSFQEYQNNQRREH